MASETTDVEVVERSRDLELVAQAWGRALQQLGSRDATRATRVFEDVLAHHRGRQHHTLSDLARQLRAAAVLAHRSTQPDVVALALVLRSDGAVSCARGGSADAAPGESRLAQLDLDEGVRERVRTLLRLADTADAPEDDEDCAVFSDVVRAPLGGAPAEYSWERARVRTTAASLRDREWWLHRRTWLVSMLGLDSIFSTPEMRAKREGRALFNLAHERRDIDDAAAMTDAQRTQGGSASGFPAAAGTGRRPRPAVRAVRPGGAVDGAGAP